MSQGVVLSTWCFPGFVVRVPSFLQPCHRPLTVACHFQPFALLVIVQAGNDLVVFPSEVWYTYTNWDVVGDFFCGKHSMLNWFKNRRRKRILRTSCPSSWISILINNVGHFKGLSSIEKNKLKAITKIIVSEKNWEAHDGLVMSDEIKVTIAGTAALLLLGVDDFYFDRVNTIIVFPHPVRRKTRRGLIRMALPLTW